MASRGFEPSSSDLKTSDLLTCLSGCYKYDYKNLIAFLFSRSQTTLQQNYAQAYTKQ